MDNTKKKQGIIALVAIIIVLVVAAILMNNPPSSATGQNKPESQATISRQTSDSDGGITKDAYDKIKTGMTYNEVKKIVGSEGKNIFESGDKGTDSYQISYMWMGKNGGEATIGFSGKSELKVILKSQSELK